MFCCFGICFPKLFSGYIRYQIEIELVLLTTNYAHSKDKKEARRERRGPWENRKMGQMEGRGEIPVWDSKMGVGGISFPLLFIYILTKQTKNNFFLD